MTIEIQECNGLCSGQSLFQDLGKYETVLDWVEAMTK